MNGESSPESEVTAGARVQVLGQSEAKELQSVRAEGDPLCMQHRLGVMVRPLVHQPASTSDADCHTILGLIFDSGLIILFLSTQSSLISSRSVLIQATAKKNDLIIYHRDKTLRTDSSITSLSHSSDSHRMSFLQACKYSFPSNRNGYKCWDSSALKVNLASGG